jgi:hypothetical protein
LAAAPLCLHEVVKLIVNAVQTRTGQASIGPTRCPTRATSAAAHANSLRIGRALCLCPTARLTDTGRLIGGSLLGL